MRRLLAITALALVPAIAVADRRAEMSKLRGELIAAITKRDVAGVTSRVNLPLRVRSMRFATAACEKFSGTDVEVTESELAAFVGCVAEVGVKHLDGPDDLWVNAVYGPGISLILSSNNGTTITTLYSMSKIGSDLVSIEPVTFTSHVKSFKRAIVPSPALKKTLDASPTDRVVAIATVCVDPAGKIVSQAKVSDHAFKTYEDDVTKAIGKWSIKPFTFGGKAIQACTTLSLGYPADRIGIPLQTPPPPPPPPPPSSTTDAATPPAGGSAPQNVPPTLLEGQRIAGDKVIMPDDLTKVAIQEAKKTRIIGSFKLCIDARGAVTTVTQLKSTGFAAYDAKILREMKKWAYTPYKVNGVDVPVCTAVTFIYSQK